MKQETFDNQQLRAHRQAATIMRRCIAPCALLGASLVDIRPSTDEIKKNHSEPTISCNNGVVQLRRLHIDPTPTGRKSSLTFAWDVQLRIPITSCSIKEIEKIDDIRESVNVDTLLIYDLDNTVFEPEGNYGSDQWYYYLAKVYRMDGYSKEESEEKALELWNNTQKLIKVKPVEYCTPRLIKDMQLKGIKTIGMTARTPATADATLEQLKSIDVNFEESSIHKEGAVHINNPSLRGSVLFQDGVLFVGEKNSKGEALMMLLGDLSFQPQNVVFVDDRLRHLISVEKELHQRNIPYVGFRYGGADRKVRAFDEFTSEISDKKTAELFYMGKS